METAGIAYFRTGTKTYEDLFGYIEKMPDDADEPFAAEYLSNVE
jgi:hypothetical protein